MPAEKKPAQVRVSLLHPYYFTWKKKQTCFIEYIDSVIEKLIACYIFIIF